MQGRLTPLGGNVVWTQWMLGGDEASWRGLFENIHARPLVPRTFVLPRPQKRPSWPRRAASAR